MSIGNPLAGFEALPAENPIVCLRLIIRNNCTIGSVSRLLGTPRPQLLGQLVRQTMERQGRDKARDSLGHPLRGLRCDSDPCRRLAADRRPAIAG